MSLPLTVLICLVVQLCMGDQPVEEAVTAKKVTLLGAWEEKSTEAADVQEATQYAVQMFNAEAKSKKLFKLVSISSAQVQITNVINFKIKAVLRKTNCRKDENHDPKTCTFEKKEIMCRFLVSLDSHNEKRKLEHQCKKNENKV